MSFDYKDAKGKTDLLLTRCTGTYAVHKNMNYTSNPIGRHSIDITFVSFFLFSVSVFLLGFA